MIADEDELGADPCHLIHDTGEIAHRRHTGLVDHDHRASVDVAVLDEVAGQRGRVDPGAGFELAGGACRRCQADDGEPGVLVQAFGRCRGCGSCPCPPDRRGPRSDHPTRSATSPPLPDRRPASTQRRRPRHDRVPARRRRHRRRGRAARRVVPRVRAVTARCRSARDRRRSPDNRDCRPTTRVSDHRVAPPPVTPAHAARWPRRPPPMSTPAAPTRQLESDRVG